MKIKFKKMLLKAFKKPSATVTEEKVKLIDIFERDVAIKIEMFFFNYEYENIIEGDWANPSSKLNNDCEAFRFLNMSEKQAERYAFNEAREYASELANDVKKLLRAYGNDYFLDVLKIDLEKELNEYLRIINNTKDLENKIIASSLRKKKAYEVWSSEVSRTNEETELKDSSRRYLLDNEFDFMAELIHLDYLREITFDTYKLGNNKDNSYLREVAYIFTVENDLITEAENDYYEVGLQLGKLTLKHLRTKKQK